MKAFFIFYYIFSALVIIGAWKFDPKGKWHWEVTSVVLSIGAAPILFPILVGVFIKETLLKSK